MQEIKSEIKKYQNCELIFLLTAHAHLTGFTSRYRMKNKNSPELFRQTKINQEYFITISANAHKEIVWFDISVNEISSVQKV